MEKGLRRIAQMLIMLVLVAAQIASAASLPALQNVRFSQTPEKVRIVFDLDRLPDYNVALEQDPLKLVISFNGSLSKNAARQFTLNDQFVNGLNISEVQPGKLQAVVNLKKAIAYKVFTLTGPNRLVVDIIKNYDQKIQLDAAPGLKYTTWLRSTQDGPTAAYILDADPKLYTLKPVLSNDVVAGLETVQEMAGRAEAIAAVNASYFAPDGQIIGLLKLDGQIVSTPSLARTALGIMPDGTIIMDKIDYNGSLTLPDGKTAVITGVNCERGPNDLILYNSYFNNRTYTNEFGIEYVISGGQIKAVNPSNSELSPDNIVISAHGTAAAALAKLKVGDKVTIKQDLGVGWEKAVYALGAGPRLVKNGGVFLTTTLEEFGSDVAGGRAPRTAIGIDKNGHILLVVVDGRQSHSIGMTLRELALFMQELGAVDAMNLDGGGSSEMVVNGDIVNSPSDGHERRVGDALAIVKKPGQ